jgi:IMP dehydrogenase
MDTVCELEMAKEMANEGAMGIIHRFMPIQKQCDQIRAYRDYFSVPAFPAAAIGATGDWEDRLDSLLNVGTDIICLDVAHADHILVHEALATILRKYGVKKSWDLIVGNIATSEAAWRLRESYLGVIDAVKVGIGPGSLCSTRLITGHGIPQVTAILEVVEAFDETDVRVIADGGFRHSGDMVKALALGADSVMTGSLIAGCKETPGAVSMVRDKLYKTYRGMASYDAMAANRRKERTPEGFTALVPEKGPVKEVLDHLAGGLESGFSYSGAHNIQELHRDAEWMRVTPAAVAEGYPHLFNWMKE